MAMTQKICLVLFTLSTVTTVTARRTAQPAGVDSPAVVFPETLPLLPALEQFRNARHTLLLWWMSLARWKGL